MKFATVIFVIAFAVLLNGAFARRRIFSSSSAANVCIIRINSSCNWSSTSTVCARYGQSNLCKKFQNNCQYQVSRCGQSSSYSSINSSYCTNIAVNSRGSCYGMSSSSSSLLSNLFGTSSSSSNVQPIIIRT